MIRPTTGTNTFYSNPWAPIQVKRRTKIFMSPDAFRDALILTGPTACGKSAAGIILAQALGAEIISMDSMALYRGMDIGTAKPSAADRALVPHHLVDCLDPHEAATLAWWLQQAAAAAQHIRERGKRILFVGGTPLYLKGLLRGIFEGPGADAAFRRQMEMLTEAELRQRLRAVDAAAEGKIKPNDRRRLIRALEVYELTGQPMSAWQTQFDAPQPRVLPPIWLHLPRAALHERIHRRIDHMIESGWVEEVKRLRAAQPPMSKQAARAAGYAELLAHLDGQCSLAEAIEQTKTRTRQLAKRQVTWFRHLEELERMDLEPSATAEEAAQRILQRWQRP